MNRLFGRRLLIAGSVNPATNATVNTLAHAVVSAVTRGVMQSGGGVVVYAGKEPTASSGLPLTFDWTVLDAAVDVVRSNMGLKWPHLTKPPIIAVGSEAALSQIPPQRRTLWEELLHSGAMRVEMIQPGARSGALLRIRQADYADVLLTLGGATGVEHLTELFLGRRRPVIPLDLPLGASRGDGIGGSERLAGRARAHPAEFMKTRPGLDPSSFLARMATYGGSADADKISSGVLAGLDALELPDAFCVRLMNSKHPDFAKVETFFVDVVHPVLLGLGMNVIDLTSMTTPDAFVNVGIFRALHYSDFVLVDLTGSRPNCFIELGYALGRALPYVITCEEGTVLPFDPDAIQRLEWQHGLPTPDRRNALRQHIESHVDRRPLVEASN